METMKYEINNIEVDGSGQPHGVLSVNKPEGITSHDVVDTVRRKYNTRKVGHAGALDPFASGVLIILVGKYTKLSDQMMNSDKEYRCKILFGLETDTLDTEGEVLKTSSAVAKVIEEKIESGDLKSIENGYMQQVPIFSSVKVDGQKLRVMARKSEKHTINGDVVTFVYKDGKEKEVTIPRKEVVFTKFEIGEVKSVGLDDIEKYFGRKLEIKDAVEFAIMDLTVACSKGTYIRQLAKDIGVTLEVPAMLVELERTRVGDVSLENAVSLQTLK